MTFTAGNVASCVAPGCRRFRSRCGHINLPRQLQGDHKALASAAEGRGGASVAKTRDAPSDPALFILSAEVDEGIEKQPFETARDPAYTEYGTVAPRPWRNLLPCASEIADGAGWARTADWRGLCHDRCAERGEPASEGIQQMRQLFRTCSFEFDGAQDGPFNLRRRNEDRHWVVFTRTLLDKLFSFIINGRTTYTAATQYLSASIKCLTIRRQDVVNIGAIMQQVIIIPPETACCPICGPNPEFNMIDGQAFGCTDPDDVCLARDGTECTVLNIPGYKVCVLKIAGLLMASIKVLRSPASLTDTQARLLLRQKPLAHPAPKFRW